MVRKRRSNIARSLKAPIPDKAIAKLRYAVNLTINPSTSVYNYVFRANSCYDPDFTGVGHQPIGFDQWMGLYNHFYVAGSKMTVDFMSTNTGVTSSSFVVGTHLDASASNTTINSELVRERANTNWTTLTNGHAVGKAKRRMKFSHRKFFRTPLFDDQFKGTASSDPEEQAYFYLWAYTPGGTDGDSIYCVVTLEFIVAFRERKPLNQS